LAQVRLPRNCSSVGFGSHEALCWRAHLRCLPWHPKQGFGGFTNCQNNSDDLRVASQAESQKVYEEFAEFCEHKSKDPQYVLKTGKAEKTDLEATIAKETAKSGAHDENIDELACAIATDEGDLNHGSH